MLGLGAVEIGEPDLHERPYSVLETRLLSQLECALVALPGLLERGSLLQPIVAGDQMTLDLCADFLAGGQGCILRVDFSRRSHGSRCKST